MEDKNKDKDIDIEKIRQAGTKYIGKNVLYYEVIDSTHIEARKLAMEKIEDGTVLIAKKQTNGIGTRGRSWYTGDKNIAMTIILYPKCSIEKLSSITIQIAECMKQAINELYSYNLKIKEPNDLMLNNKKICGILTQIATKDNNIDYLLISLGFNVNEEQFSNDIAQTATSLRKEYSKEFERERIICKFLEILEKKIEYINCKN